MTGSQGDGDATRAPVRVGLRSHGPHPRSLARFTDHRVALSPTLQERKKL